MPYSQPPFNATSQASDWSPFLEQGSSFSTNDNLDLDYQWPNEALASFPNNNHMIEGQTVAGFDMGLPAPQQNFFPTNDHSIAAPEPQHGAAASSSFNPLMDDNAWMFQPGSMAGATYRCEADSLAGPATFGISAPFGASQWGLPQMVDQPMSLVPQAGATPFESMLEPMASMHAAQPGVGSASTPADAGEAEILDRTFHEKRDGRYHCLMQPCSKSFTREADLFRHQNGYHLQATAYWCSNASCERGVAGRPFPRKDKRNEHERKVHGFTRPRSQ